MNDRPSPVLTQLLEWAASFATKPAEPESRLYADLGINGYDFIEFVEMVERAYRVDLSWVSSRDRRVEAQDATIKSIADYVAGQLA